MARHIGMHSADTRLMRYQNFASWNALSTERQPALADLIDAFRDSDQRITIFAGAGVAIDAGLPSWKVLIDRIADRIGDESIRARARSDASDPMRKAEYLIGMIGEQDAETEELVIRKALYGKERSSRAGALSDAIARLVVLLGDRVSLLTTNFDDCLETSLGDYFSKSGTNGTSQGTKKPAPTVVHLHGLLPPDHLQAPEGPLVLTESRFLEAGPRVQEAIRHALDTTVCVFVGVSLTDPNLVWPLWERAHIVSEPSSAGSEVSTPSNATERSDAGGRTSSGPFVLTVPGQMAFDPMEPSTEELRDEAIRYEFQCAHILARTLDVTPIFLKSYSQQLQLLHDLCLAVRLPREYPASPGHPADAPLRYGNRFVQALDAAYDAVQCQPPGHAPTDEAATSLARALSDVVSGVGGLSEVIADLRQEINTIHDRKGTLAHVDPNEEFGVFLWLRSRRDPDKKAARYSLNLVGSSTHAVRSQWALRREVPISPLSRFAAASALFDGRTQLKPLEPNDSFPWAGIIAIPLIAEGQRSTELLAERYLDSLYLGAVTLNTTAPVIEDEERRGPMSVLGILNDEELEVVMDTVHRGVLKVLGLVGT